MSQAPASSVESLTEVVGTHDANVHGFQARYLFGFRFDVAKINEIEKRLSADTFATLKGKATAIWEPPVKGDDGGYKIEHVYRDELLHAVTKYLFTERSAHDCRWFRASEVLTNAWFADLSCQWKERGAFQQIPLRLIDSARVELLLSPQGIGVLSIAIEIVARGIRLDQIVATNYRLSQFRRRNNAVELRHAHPSDDPQRWQRMPEEARSQLRVVTADDPIETRLQAPGGVFILPELVDRLLAPFVQAGSPVIALQDELFAYSVLRLKAGIDFDRRVDRDHWCTWLARLAQVEEAFHPSCGPGSMQLAESVLNRLHWAAIGQLGAAHLIADEAGHAPGEQRPDFDEQKPGIVRDKYFVPYLVALVQKLTIHTALHDARQIADAPESELPTKLAELRSELLHFGVRGYFAQISTRESLHRFYQLVQRGLDVPTNWMVLQRSLLDLESSVNDRTAAKQQTSMDENLHEIRTVQTFLHFLEYPLISVYFAHLWHMYAETRWPEDHHFVSDGVVVAAVLGFVVVFISDWFDVPSKVHAWLHTAKARRKRAR